MAQSSQGFQSIVNQLPSPGLVGAPASLNPQYYYPAGPGGLVAGDDGAADGGILVGRWAWLSQNYLNPDNQPNVVNNFGSGLPIGLVPNHLQGLVTVFLKEASLLLPSGLPVGILTAGDTWIINGGSTQALIGQKVYAAFADGSSSFAATGSPTTGASGASSSIAPSTFSVTGSISGNVLTVTAVGSGPVVRGAAISGTNVASGTLIASQLSGAAGGVGTYAVSIGEQSAASTAISGTYGTLTLGTVTGGIFAVNDVISGSGVTSGSVLTQLLTGTGGTGSTFAVNPSQTAGSTTISVAAINVETAWYAQSSGNPGEIVKISRLP
jgi:hypothetical protein